MKALLFQDIPLKIIIKIEIRKMGNLTLKFKTIDIIEYYTLNERPGVAREKKNK